VSVLLFTAGFDEDIVDRLAPDDARFFAIASAISIAASVLVGVGLTFGAGLALELWPLAGVVGLVGLLFALNLFRLLHAGTGFPLHEDVAELDRWRPPPTGAFVLFLLGAMLLQPVVLFALGSATAREGNGLIALGLAAWSRPGLAVLLTVVLALLMSATSWLRFFNLGPLRAYERHRWHRNRGVVDGAWQRSQEVITEDLRPHESFSGELRVHYDTKPMPFGIDPARVEREMVKFVPPEDEPEEEEELLPAEAPIAAPAPKKTEPAPDAPPQVPEPPPKEDALFPREELGPTDAGVPPRLAFFDVGRINAARAREHVDEIAPFVSELLGRDEDEVRALIRVSPDDLQLFRLFSEWKEPGVVLLKTAGFARQHGLAKAVSIYVGRPVEEVVARIDDAPADKKLSSVFAPELAKRLLGKDISHLK
jgi:hypothetical protein